MDYVADNDLTVAWEWNEEKTAMMTAYDENLAAEREREEKGKEKEKDA